MVAVYVLAGYCVVSYVIVGAVLVGAARRHPDTASIGLLFIAFAPIILPVWALNHLRGAR